MEWCAVDAESREWLAQLNGHGNARTDAIRRLHELLVRVGRREVHRRGTRINGAELEDIVQQAASDATIAILRKLTAFRGDSRFTTWASRFVILEAASKIGRHHWRHPRPHLAHEDWEQIPERPGGEPSGQAEAADLWDAICHAVDTKLTERQRRVFVGIVFDQIPADTLGSRLGMSRNALYKTVFDARRKIRAHLVDREYLPCG
ncbi:MAG: sigma-70 family RNA polymerase sigma factor [Mycolicibacterium sp.]